MNSCLSGILFGCCLFSYVFYVFMTLGEVSYSFYENQCRFPALNIFGTLMITILYWIVSVPVSPLIFVAWICTVKRKEK